jgi:phytoene synthase
MIDASLETAAIDESTGFFAVPADSGDVIRRHSRSFTAAAKLLPAGVRRDVEKLYGWCRWCDEAVDAAGDADQTAERLGQLRDDVARIYRGEAPTHAASNWLAHVVDRHAIEAELPAALLDGMERDRKLGHIGSESELLLYCYQAAGVVGLMMCRIFGVRHRQADRHAKALGIAMQLTNIARDVREDWDRGRCYIPDPWIRVRLPNARRPANSEVKAAVRRLLDLAEDHYSFGQAGIRYLPRGVRPAIRVAGSVYREIGREIRRKDFRVMDRRVFVDRPRMLSVAVQTLLSGMISDVLLAVGASRSTCEHRDGLHLLSRP